MIYLICVVFGVFLGQEYSTYLPNIKILTLHLLTYLKDKTTESSTISSKEIEKKNNLSNVNGNNTTTIGIINSIYKFFT